jgi:hypothetical protein
MAPNHLCAWRKDLLFTDDGLIEKFPDLNLSEDHRWAEAMEKHYKTVHNIEMVLYFYMYDKVSSETHN